MEDSENFRSYQLTLSSYSGGNVIESEHYNLCLKPGLATCSQQTN